MLFFCESLLEVVLAYLPAVRLSVLTPTLQLFLVVSLAILAVVLAAVVSTAGLSTRPTFPWLHPASAAIVRWPQPACSSRRRTMPALRSGRAWADTCGIPDTLSHDPGQ